MSRSFKRVPAYTSSGNSYRKWAKRAANKKVRRTKGLSNGKSYVKVFCSYEIDDWKCLYFRASDYDYIYRNFKDDKLDARIYRTINK